MTSTDEVIEEIKKQVSEENEDQNLCRVELVIFPREQHLSIEFTKNLEERDLEDQDVQFGISMESFDDQDPELIYSLEHACSDNGCELEFFKQYLDWFINTSRVKYSNEIATLILGNNEESGQCFNESGVLEECSSGQCVASVEQYNNDPPLESQSCVAVDKEEPAGFHIMVKFNINFEHVVSSYTLHCNYNECNNERTKNDTFKLLKEEYEVKSILKVLGYKSEDGKADIETTISSIISSSSREQTNPVQSSTTTKSLTSTSTTKPVASASSDRTTTTITTTSTEGSGGQRRRSTNTIIYAAFIIFIIHLPFRA